MTKISAAAFAKAGFAYLGTPYTTMDCQAFIERCMRDVGLRKDLPGSNAWYRAMTWTGTPEECKARFGSVPPGALLFILSHDGKEPAKYRKDGIGNASHVGIRTASGQGAIHSSASRGMVCESSFEGKTIRRGGWNRVGLWNVFDYGDRINLLLQDSGNLAGQDQDEKADNTENTRKGDETIMETTKVVWAAQGEDVFLRPTRSKNAPFLTRIPLGETVTVQASQDGWSAVSWQGYKGWMKSEFLRDPDQAAGAGSSLSAAGDGYALSASDPTDLASGVGTVTVSLPAQKAQILLPILDTLADQLAASIGRG